MRGGQKNVTMAIIAMIAFWVVSGVYIWRLIEQGVGAGIVVPAICFPIAAGLLTCSVMTTLKARKDSPE